MKPDSKILLNGSVKHDFAEADDQMLACAIWFKEICRKFRIPSTLQFEILQNAGGLSKLWNYSLYDIFTDRGKTSKINKPCGKILKDLNDCWKSKSDRDRACRQSDAAEKMGIRAVDITSSDYPYRLKAINSRPNILFYRGSCLRLMNQIPFCVTIVGTRNPTPYGTRVAENFSRHLSSYDTVVVSGLARGIDTIVHQTVISECGITAAVLACGLDITYPPENTKLQQTIAEQGLLISEHPPGVKPVRQFFPARNRILSGISDAVIVTESTSKSGTLITAGFAADQGRDVYAVPGSILNHSSAGCHGLIKDGAMLIESAAEALAGRNCGLRNLECPLSEDRDNVQNNAVESKIQQALLSMSLNLDELAAETAENIAAVSAALTIMEIKGNVTCHRGRYFLTDTSSCCI